MNAKKVSGTEFERHTLVSIDRYIAFIPREEKINTLNELSRIRRIKIPNINDNGLKSDLDIHIDPLYGEIEYHLIGNRLFARVILNSILLSTKINLQSLIRTWCITSSKVCKGYTVDLVLINGDVEEFTRYSAGSIVSTLSEGAGTFDKVWGMYNFAIGDIMKKIDENVDVIIAPKLVRELESTIVKAKETVNRLRELGITDERIENDNTKHIRQNEQMLLQAKEDLYREANVEEVYFKIERLG